MTRRFIPFIALSLITIAPVAWAQESTPAPSDSKVRAGKTVYDFDEVDILGQLKRPQVTPIVEAPEFRFRRLLDLDESFLPNIVRAADEF